MRKRNRGQNLDINANDWNRVCDLANQKIGQQPGSGSRLQPNCIWVKNTLGRDLSRYAAVCIGYPTPVEWHTGKNDQVMQLINGSVQGRDANYFGQEPVIGILQEPIANGRYGQAQITGVTPAYFRAGEVQGIGASQVLPDFATISDIDDALVFSTIGPIRFLHRNMGGGSGTSWGTGVYRWVLLGGPPISLGRVIVRGNYDGTGNTGGNWTGIVGDQRSVGLYGSTGVSGAYPSGALMLCRPGRYAVNVRYDVPWSNPSGGFSTGDRAEWRATWGSIRDFGTCTPSAWSEGPSITGERSFAVDVAGAGTPVTIVLPVIEGRRIALSGTATTLTILSGSIEVEVIMLGAKDYHITWSKDLKDTAFARGASAGPL